MELSYIIFEWGYTIKPLKSVVSFQNINTLDAKNIIVAQNFRKISQMK